MASAEQAVTVHIEVELGPILARIISVIKDEETVEERMAQFPRQLKTARELLTAASQSLYWVAQPAQGPAYAYVDEALRQAKQAVTLLEQLSKDAYRKAGTKESICGNS